MFEKHGDLDCVRISKFLEDRDEEFDPYTPNVYLKASFQNKMVVDYRPTVNTMRIYSSYNKTRYFDNCNDIKNSRGHFF